MKRFSILALCFISSLTFAQTAPPTAPPAAPAKQEEKKQEPPKQEDKRTAEQKKYDELLKNPAIKTSNGAFKVHRVEDKVYFEIPESKFGRIYMWSAEVAELPKELGYPGTAVPVKTFRLARKDKKVQIKAFNPSTRATGNDKGVNEGVRMNTPEPILMTYDMYAEGPDKSVVIDVTSFFTSDPQDFSVRSAIPGAMAVDSAKTGIESVKAFPNNIEIRTNMTFMMGASRGGGLSALFGGGGAPYTASRATTLIHYSLVELPETPMMGRLKDSRIGFFTVGFTEFGGSENKAKEVEYITRYRLEKKDPKADLSEPVKPIVYYVAREVPDKWKEYVRQGIDDWQPAFEQAGFKNAIVGKLAPSVQEDPSWDPENASFSVIRWAPSEIANAMGPSIQDPRSGETISAHVIVWNDIVKLVQDWYFAQCAAIDPKAQKLPMSDELIGRLIRYVVAHEVGHTLGLEHNFKASAAYTTAQLRDKKFTDQYGVASSIMSYSRYNYVAQPGDGVTSTVGVVGPYDKFAIQYGYMPIKAGSPEGEMPVLDALLGKQVSNSWLRFGNYKYSGIDPQMQSEIIGNDPVESTRLGLLNLDRIASTLAVPAATKFGKSYDDLQDLYGNLIQQWVTELMHVQQLVGGVVEQDNHVGRGGDAIFTPVSADQQSKAVNLLMTRGVRPSFAIINPKVFQKIQPAGYVDSINSIQTMIVRGLLSDAKVKRLQDFEATQGSKAYTVNRLVDDVVRLTFAEVNNPTAKTDHFGRNLHRSFFKIVDGRVNGSGASQTDVRPLLKNALVELDAKLKAASSRSTDKVTKAHYNECRNDIAKILTDTYTKSGGSAPAPSLLELLQGLPFHMQEQANCWTRSLPTALKELKKELESEAKRDKK
jgi:hypothetical protein